MSHIKRKRRNWSSIDKMALVQLLSLPMANGKPKTVTALSAEYGISRKLLYEWQATFHASGENGLNKKIRKVAEAKFRDPALINEIGKLVLIHPDWSLRLISQHLNKYIGRISEPTIQKILVGLDLETSGKRYAATEKSYLDSGLPIPTELFAKLCKNNPCMDQFRKNYRDGLRVAIDVLPLEQYFGAESGYLICAIEWNSLYTFGIRWAGKNQKSVYSFIRAVEYALRHNLGGVSTFWINQKWPFISNTFHEYSFDFHVGEIPDSRKTRKFVGANEVVFRMLKDDFINNYEFSNVNKLKSDFSDWLVKFNTKQGPLGYPTFSRSPQVVLKTFDTSLSLDEIFKRYETIIK